MKQFWDKIGKYLVSGLIGVILSTASFLTKDYIESQRKKGGMEVKYTSLENELDTFSNDLKDVNRTVNKAEKKIDKIGDCLNREIIPTLNEIAKRTIQPVQLALLSKSVDETKLKINDIQEQLNDTSRFMASLNQEFSNMSESINQLYTAPTLPTVEGKLISIDLTAGTLEMIPRFEDSFLAAFGNSIKSVIFYISPFSTLVNIDKQPTNIKALKSIEPGRNIEIKCLIWGGKLFAYSVEVK